MPAIATLAESTSTAFTTSLTITKPANVEVGDLLLAAVSGRCGSAGSVSGVTLPTGWELVVFGDTGDVNGNASYFAAWKIAVSADLSATDYTFTYQAGSGTSLRACGGIFRITDFDADAPVFDFEDNSGTTGDIVGLSTYGPESSLLIYVGGSSSASATPDVALPTGMTSQWHITNGTSGTSRHGQRAASLAIDGITGDKTSTHNGVHWAGMMLIIPPPKPQSVRFGRDVDNGTSFSSQQVRGMGGTFPNIEGAKLESVSINVAEHSRQGRLAVYIGGALDAPEGATLLEDLGQTTGSDTGFITVTSATNPTIPANSVVWVWWKTDGTLFTTRYQTDSGGAGDFQTVRGRAADPTAVSNDPAVGWPATMPGGSGFGNFWYSTYLNYELDDGGNFEISGSAAVVGVPGSVVNQDVNPSGVLAGAASIGAVVNQDVHPAGAVAAKAGVSHVLNQDFLISGSVSAKASSGVTVDQDFHIEGSVSGKTGIGATVNQDASISGAVAAKGSAQSTINQDALISGSVQAVGIPDHELEAPGGTEYLINGSVSAKASSVATINQDAHPQGAVSAVAAAASTMNQDIHPVGAANAKASVGGVVNQDLLHVGQVAAKVAVAHLLNQDFSISGAVAAKGLGQSIVNMDYLSIGRLVGRLLANAIVNQDIHLSGYAASVGVPNSNISFIGDIAVESVILAMPINQSSDLFMPIESEQSLEMPTTNSVSLEMPIFEEAV